MCHCSAGAVPNVTLLPGTACFKQWHTVVKNAGWNAGRHHRPHRNSGRRQSAEGGWRPAVAGGAGGPALAAGRKSAGGWKPGAARSTGGGPG